MIVEATFYNEQCDVCGSLADAEMWHNEANRCDLEGDGHWQHLGGKDYCPGCWYWDDDDNIVTADGKVWSEDGDFIRDVTPSEYSQGTYKKLDR